MKNLFSIFTFTVITAFCLQTSFAQTIAEYPWTFITEDDLQVSLERRPIIPKYYNMAKLDVAAIQSQLIQAPLWLTAESESNAIELSLPMPNGNFERFRLQYAPVLHEKLAERYPTMRSYAGTGVDDPTAYLRCDLTQFGFHASIYSAKNGTVLIDPYSTEDIENYIVYYRKDYMREQDWECMTESSRTNLNEHETPTARTPGNCKMLTYRFALACTGEYATARGGSLESVMAAFNTSMTRINGVYERELAVHLELVENNDQLIFLDAFNDPYHNGYVSLGTLIVENQQVCDLIIGTFNYDIGHLFGIYGEINGLGLPGICNPNLKAQGASCFNSPVDDAFDISIAAHEIGHQFGATHIFNDKEIPNYETSVEPGSGSTLMSYAGHGRKNVQKYKDDYFNGINLVEISNFMSSGGNCVLPEITYAPPVVNAGIDYVIPKQTNFKLTAVAPEPSTSLTYCWEQNDVFNTDVILPPQPTDIFGPMFRSYPPVTSPSRYFPNPDNPCFGSENCWERLSSVARTLNFRLTVRDNHVGGGCTNEDFMAVTVDPSSGPFVITSQGQDANNKWPVNSQQTITWDVANTNVGAVNCSHVDILLSVDGGKTFDITLASNTPNDGSEMIRVPNHQTSDALIMVRGVGNIFFDINDSRIKINVNKEEVSGTFVEWDNTLGGGITMGSFALNDELKSIKQTSDGGYIVGGYSWSNMSTDKSENNLSTNTQTVVTPDYWVIKLNANGVKEWDNTLGGSSIDILEIVQPTSDGGYFLGGHSNSNNSPDKSEDNLGQYDYWVVKLNAAGVKEWDNTIGASGGSDQLYAIQQTTDGGYILGGYSNSNSSPDKLENNLGQYDYWVVKLNAAGVKEWDNTIGGSGDDQLYSLQQTTDGGYILGGYSNSNSSPDKSEMGKGGYDYWVVKLNAGGVKEWDNTIGGSGDDKLYAIKQTTEGGYILGGYSNSNSSPDKYENSLGGNDYWIVKLYASGIIQWDNTIGGNHNDELFSLQVTTDGGYILGGSSWSNSSPDKSENNLGFGYDYWVVKLNVGGIIQWENTIGGSYYDELFSIEQTIDEGYIMGGRSESNFSPDKSENNLGQYDYWVVKLSTCPAIRLTFPTESLPSCQGTATGSITVDPPGEDSNYEYLWSNGEDANTIESIPAGAYTVLVTQTTTGCTAVATTILDDAEPLPTNLIINNYPDCNSNANGSLQIVPDIYHLGYTWNTGANTNQIDNLTAGTYAVTTTDIFGCSAVDVKSLPAPLDIDVEYEQTNTDEWLVTVYGIHGTPPFEYRKCPTCQWKANKNEYKVGAGTYTFGVKDVIEDDTPPPVVCVKELTLQLPPPGLQNGNSPAFLSNGNNTYLSVFPNPTTGVLQISTLTPIQRILVIDLLGKVVQEISGDIRELNISHLPSGIYNLVVTFEETGVREIVRALKN